LATLSHSFVGIFWAVQERGSAAVLLDHRCPISEAEPYGDMLTCPNGHYEVWEQWRKDARNGRSGLDLLIATDADGGLGTRQSRRDKFRTAYGCGI
jgi:hypothetical protein